MFFSIKVELIGADYSMFKLGNRDKHKVSILMCMRSELSKGGMADTIDEVDRLTLWLSGARTKYKHLAAQVRQSLLKGTLATQTAEHVTIHVHTCGAPGVAAHVKAHTSGCPGAVQHKKMNTSRYPGVA